MAKSKVSKPGYHLRKIRKGKLGEISKIQEELDELKDAWEQKCKIMALVELSDLVGAIELFVQAKFNMGLRDLERMSKITRRGL